MAEVGGHTSEHVFHDVNSYTRRIPWPGFYYMSLMFSVVETQPYSR